ncbi:hypothetical protein CWI36_0002p0040 [Hamiltosporidium magnivora]|uniref:Uncharacterized protein n=1 Tax=Hamiltosporidium magnivora TaxID=148818 RepID=A0A4Q9LP40_9MICR|nr:hypothetical protein CWI36_0002p0040 [Hamiltosporidium magnivora]
MYDCGCYGVCAHCKPCYSNPCFKEIETQKNFFCQSCEKKSVKFNIITPQDIKREACTGVHKSTNGSEHGICNQTKNEQNLIILSKLNEGNICIHMNLAGFGGKQRKKVPKQKKKERIPQESESESKEEEEEDQEEVEDQEEEEKEENGEQSVTTVHQTFQASKTISNVGESPSTTEAQISSREITIPIKDSKKENMLLMVLLKYREKYVVCMKNYADAHTCRLKFNFGGGCD